MNATPKTITKKGDLILIEARKCSDKVQPDVKVDMLYLVLEVGKLKNGHTSLLCTRDKEHCKTVRINEDRFYWRKVSQQEIRRKTDEMQRVMKERMEKAKEEEFRAEVRRTTENLRRKFTHGEHLQISFVPLVLADMAWVYAYRCRQWCADNRIGETKKLGRALLEVRHKYEMSILRDLNRRHLDHVREEADKFLQDDLLGPTLIKAEFSLANEFYRQHGNDIPLLKLRVYAVIGMMIIHAYRRHNKKMTALIRSRIPNKVDADDSTDNRFIVEHLYACFDAYLGDYTLKESNETKLIERIIDRAVAESQLELKADEHVGQI